jgi:2'-5' RNA ligase
MKRIRTFACIEIDGDLRKKMSQVSAKLSSAGADVKWVGENNLHLTLKFLGNVDDTQIPKVADAVKRIAGQYEPFEFTIGGVGTFPEGGMPRVIWIGLDEPTRKLEKMYYALDEALSPFAEKAEHRTFSPHITIGRVNSSRGREGLLKAIDENRDADIGVQAVEEITVMMSELTREGPLYTPLSKAALSGG